MLFNEKQSQTDDVESRGRSSSSFGEDVPFLPVHSDKKAPRIWSPTNIYIVFLHIILIITWGVVWLRPVPSTRPTEHVDTTWSPARQFVEYETHSVHSTDASHDSVYAGTPTPEQNEAWDHLIAPIYFNATAEEIEKMNESPDRLAEAEEGGYLASLGVYHELHCVRQLRLYLYRDHYYNELSEDQLNYLENHLDHCLETIRITLMCHGNVGIYTYFWDDPVSWKPSLRSNSKDMCTKWSSLEDWAYSRRLESLDPWKSAESMGFD